MSGKGDSRLIVQPLTEQNSTMLKTIVLPGFAFAAVIATRRE
jgi:hypothetical protein